jgi:hypothetical protein
MSFNRSLFHGGQHGSITTVPVPGVGVGVGVNVRVVTGVRVGVGVMLWSQANVSLTKINSPGFQSRFAVPAIGIVTVCGPNVAAATTLKGTVGLLVVTVMPLMNAGGQPASCGSKLLKVKYDPMPYVATC